MALALINNTRVARGGLPSLTAADLAAAGGAGEQTGGGKVPGGVDCVPKPPVAATQVPTCGTIFEAMKWEKRIEVAYTTYSPWYLDSRGWGDLAKDVPTFFVTPFGDLQARHLGIYSAGNGPGAAPNSFQTSPSTYGW